MDCIWVGRKGDAGSRRQEKCNRPDVPVACPVQCGLCCADDASFTFEIESGVTQDCSYFEKNWAKRKGYCDKIQVKTACAFSCGNCFAPVQPKEEKDKTEDDPDCVSDSYFRMNGKKNKNCNWVAEKGDKGNRRKKSCRKNSVAEACPAACGLCCADDPTFRFRLDNGNKQDCKWIDDKYKKRKGSCDDKKVKAACGRTCQNCFEPVKPKKNNN